MYAHPLSSAQHFTQSCSPSWGACSTPLCASCSPASAHSTSAWPCSTRRRSKGRLPRSTSAIARIGSRSLARTRGFGSCLCGAGGQQVTGSIGHRGMPRQRKTRRARSWRGVGCCPLGRSTASHRWNDPRCTLHAGRRVRGLSTEWPMTQASRDSSTADHPVLNVRLSFSAQSAATYEMCVGRVGKVRGRQREGLRLRARARACR
mmetsp:Transcript_59410/g.118041  ORF Transcript_59410/g.118041 Transcript_59410/m.118041 type:complete len:205 (+) Transcript_59410:813-1427(+)